MMQNGLAHGSWVMEQAKKRVKGAEFEGSFTFLLLKKNGNVMFLPLPS
jgi:hypothetical protein